eukprot:gb/GECG01000163.1/.p1 GENE.gb/GECG01000163.1/~~gb/GECG01000163.1/.p1  ORF type:complete len:1301 (+),score=162.13 gb/GECG01000163.1/:1-3903(+)
MAGVQSTGGKVILSLAVIVIPSLSSVLGNAIYRSLKLRFVRREHPFHARVIDQTGLSANKYSGTMIAGRSEGSPSSTGGLLEPTSHGQLFYNFIARLLRRLKWTEEGELKSLPLHKAVQRKVFDSKTRKSLADTLSKILLDDSRWDTQRPRWYNPEYWVCGRLLPTRLMNEAQFENNIFHEWMNLLETEYLEVWEALETTDPVHTKDQTTRVPAQLTGDTEFNRPAVSDMFVERPQLLEKMHSWGLYANSLENQRSMLILHGIGGAGKSQLAAHYFSEPTCKEKYDMKAWFVANSVEELQRQYVEFYAAYRREHQGGSMPPLNEKESLEDQASRVRTWLNRLGRDQGKKLLLMYDNAPGRNAVKNWLPEADCPHHLVINSRDPRSWRYYMSSGTENRELNVDIMTRMEAIELIRIRCCNQDYEISIGEDEMANLAELLGYLPLALTQAVHYMQEQRLDVATFRSQYLNHKQELLDSDTEDGRKSVRVTYDLSIKQLSEKHPCSLKLLNHLAWLSSFQIPDYVFCALVGRFKEVEDAKFEYPTLRSKLETYGMLRWESGTSPATLWFSMHPLIQEIVCCRQREYDSVQYWLTCCDVVTQLAVHSDEGSLEYNRSLLSHAEALHRQSEKMCEFSLRASEVRRKQQTCYCRMISSSKFWRCCCTSKPRRHRREGKWLKIEPRSLGAIYLVIGQYKMAKKYCEYSLSVSQKLCHTNLCGNYKDSRMAVSMYQLGTALIKTGEYSLARYYLEHALLIYKKNHKEDHPKVVETLEKFAFALLQVGDARRAKEYLEKVLSIRKQYQENQIPDDMQEWGDAHFIASPLWNEQIFDHEGKKLLATTLLHLGEVKCKLGDAESAKTYFEQSLSRRRKLYTDPNHPAILAAVEARGRALHQLGDAEGAKNCIEQALYAAQKYFGETHVEVARIVGNLGVALSNLGEAQGAKACIEEGLKIDREYYGRTHLVVAHRLCNLGHALHNLGDAQGAKKHLEDALKIQEDHFMSNGDDNYVALARTLECLGLALRDVGEIQRARECFERAYPIVERYYGKNHVMVASPLERLGLTFSDIGNERFARECLEKALHLKQQYYGPKHPEVAYTLENFGYALTALGDAESGKDYLEQALPIFQHYFGDTHGSVAFTMGDLGMALSCLGNARGATDYLTKALYMTKRYHGENNARVAKTLLKFASVSYNLRDLEGAKNHIEEALDIQKRCYEDSHISLAGTLERLGAVMFELGEVEGAKEKLKNALDIKQGYYKEPHFDVAETFRKLALATHELGDKQRSEEYHEQALEIIRSISEKEMGM